MHVIKFVNNFGIQFYFAPMKNLTVSVVITAISVLFVNPLAAQDEEVASAVARSFTTPTHIIKTNLPAYGLGSVNLNYEYRLGQKTSLGLMGNYSLSNTEISVSAAADLSSGKQEYDGSFRIQNGINVTPYFRWYPKESLTGFYLEGFVRYFDFSFDLPYEYDKEDQTVMATAAGTADGIGGGIALGWQFHVAKRWFLDVGFGSGVATGKIQIVTSEDNLDAADYQEIKESIEANRDAEVDIPLLNGLYESMEVDANDESAWVHFNNVLIPIARGCISVGYTF